MAAAPLLGVDSREVVVDGLLCSEGFHMLRSKLVAVGEASRWSARGGTASTTLTPSRCSAFEVLAECSSMSSIYKCIKRIEEQGRTNVKEICRYFLIHHKGKDCFHVRIHKLQHSIPNTLT